MGQPLTRRRRGFLARWAPPLLAGPAVVFGALGWAYLAAGGPPPAAEGIRPSLADLPTEGEEMLAPAREVTAPGVTPGPKVGGPLKRVAAAARRPDPPPPPAETLFRRVIVLDAGGFRMVRERQALVVRIAGVVAPGFAETCVDGAGKTWKCGARARAELARLIGGRAVACADLVEEDAATVTARCRVGSHDLARWLIEQGWADPAPGADAPTLDGAAKAKAEGRGRFGPAPSGVIAG